MSHSRNPFAAQAGGDGMGRGTVLAWSVAVIIALAAAVLVFFGYRVKTAQDQVIKAERAQSEAAKAELSRALDNIRTNQDTIVALKRQVADLEREKASVGQKAKTLEEEMLEKLASKDVTISKLQGKLTVTIIDRVMFDSGEAVLKPDGAAVMQKIADLLAGHPELQIHVVGHTDNVPIRQTAQSRFASNWELSTARALAAVHFLTEKAGVDPRRLGAVGYGEYRPVADNSSAEGRAKNRRIAISILPEEFVCEPAAPANPGSSEGTQLPKPDDTPEK